MFDLVMAAAFENVAKTDQVALDIGVRVAQRVTYAGLSRQMDDALESFVGEQRAQRRGIGDVHAQEAEVGVRFKAIQPGQF